MAGPASVPGGRHPSRRGSVAAARCRQSVRVLGRRKRDVTEVAAPSTVSGADAEDWLLEGTAIVHAAFGTGRVAHVGPYKGVQTVWVDFDSGDRRPLDPEYASPHVRLRSGADAETAPDPAITCDVCGGRPVVVTIAGTCSTERFCEAHRTS
jgi:hypothetical protein